LRLVRFIGIQGRRVIGPEAARGRLVAAVSRLPWYFGRHMGKINVALVPREPDFRSKRPSSALVGAATILRPCSG
jgi:hypothetical protein